MQEFRDSDRYTIFMNRMLKSSYMKAINHIEERFHDITFEPYELHPNMDEQPVEVWQADKFCIYWKIPSDDDIDLEDDDLITKDLRPKQEFLDENLDDACPLSNSRRKEKRMKTGKDDLSWTNPEVVKFRG